MILMKTLLPNRWCVVLANNLLDECLHTLGTADFISVRFAAGLVLYSGCYPCTKPLTTATLPPEAL